MNPDKFAREVWAASKKHKTPFLLLYKKKNGLTSVLHTIKDDVDAATLLKTASEEIAAGRIKNPENPIEDDS